MTISQILEDVQRTGEVNDTQRLEFIMTVAPNEAQEFTRHVLGSGGDGDIGDCRSFVDRLIRRRLPNGFKYKKEIEREIADAKATLRKHGIVGTIEL